jgi:hypothetical protein
MAVRRLGIRFKGGRQLFKTNGLYLAQGANEQAKKLDAGKIHFFLPELHLKLKLIE